MATAGKENEDAQVPPISQNRKREAGKGKGKGKGKPELAPANLGAGMKKFTRGDRLLQKAKGVQEKKLGSTLKRNRARERKEVVDLSRGEILQTEEQGLLEAEGEERTWKFSQRQIAKMVTVGAAKKQFDFALPYGPYRCSYTDNGRHLIVGGRKGHIAQLECEKMQLCCEMQAKETVHDVQALHNHLLFAVAQKKYTFIYDNQGTEVHCMDYTYVTHLEFLPYHFLLVLAGEGKLHYRDISSGEPVVSHFTRLGPPCCMRQNPYNAVVHVGHSRGLVSLWTPSIKDAVMKISAHPGHVTGLAVRGNYMVTTGAEGVWKVWDLRKTESTSSLSWRKCSGGYGVADLDISMTGLLGLCVGNSFEVWKDVFSAPVNRASLYLQEEYGKSMTSSCRFRPYEDVCALGMAEGFSSLLVPGAGVANFDSFEANPFESKKQRREREVRRLIDKLQPDTIMLDPHQIGNVNPKAVQEYKSAKMDLIKEREELAQKKLKKKMRGGNKAGNREKRKQLRQAEDQRQKTKNRVAGEDGGLSDVDGQEDGDGDGEDSGEEGAEGKTKLRRKGDGTALGRFYFKRPKA